MELKNNHSITLTVEASENLAAEFIINRVGYHDKVVHTVLGGVLRRYMNEGVVYSSLRFTKERKQNEYPQLTDAEVEEINQLIIGTFTNLPPGSIENVGQEGRDVQQAILKHLNKQ